jgi:hypothetical protein
VLINPLKCKYANIYMVHCACRTFGIPGRNDYSRSQDRTTTGALGLNVDGVLQDSVDDLRKALAKAKPAMYIARQRFTLPLAEGEKKPTVLGSGKKLSDYGLTEGSKVVFKDLGPQVMLLDCSFCCQQIVHQCCMARNLL